jgi:hypothetical protein
MYCEAIKYFRDELANFPIEEVSLTTLSHCWKSKIFPHEFKMCVLELLAKKLERDIELLNTHMKSYSFQHPKQFYEQLTSPKPKDIVSSFDFLINESFVGKHKSDVEQLQSWSDIEDTNRKLIHVKMLKEYLLKSQQETCV